MTRKKRRKLNREPHAREVEVSLSNLDMRNAYIQGKAGNRLDIAKPRAVTFSITGAANILAAWDDMEPELSRRLALKP